VARKALCVGINVYPYAGNDLNGCLNDARAWAELLAGHYDFPGPDVRLLLDTEARKADVVASLRWLLAGAKAGDVLVFTNASHGTYLADTSGDEERYDQAICPYDCADNLLVDDELRVLFADLPKGVSLTVIADSCFSGTVTRAAVSGTPDDRRRRFLSPALRGGQLLENPLQARPKTREKVPQSGMKEVLLSACTHQEYAHDARIGGVYHGALTYFALQAIREADYAITYQELHTRLTHRIADAGYPQHSQLEGRRPNRKRLIFS
jgi:hypothetical protein